ncbi:hypothetical protein cypCar_00039742 [Cyprinus carpio]|nr:hypothetical protein cypCar_00039742 [Cyprinus carpio]
MVLAMIMAFFICWLLYTTISVVVVVDPEIYIPPRVTTMPIYFAKTSSVYNPIIYFLTNKRVFLRIVSGNPVLWVIHPSSHCWRSNNVLNTEEPKQD